LDIVVCVKRVPDLSEADVSVDRSGKAIKSDDLVFDINEWDSYAMEEAVQLRDELGGTVTAITLGPDESDEVLRRCLALGADTAAHVSDPALDGGDGHATAVALAAAIRKQGFDLVLTGFMAADDGLAQVGPSVAQMLGVPHATLVTGVEIDGKVARVRRELEGGLEEVVELQLPAVLTIQTGINEPRYVSIAGIRRASRRDVPILGLAELGLGAGDVGETGSRVELVGLSLPPAGEKGEMLEGKPDAVAGRLVEIFAGKGWLG
jgi:electron transfer flavoprotein beta subunit